MKLLKIYLSLLLCIYAATGCLNNPESEIETYITTEKLYDDCSVYQMIFNEDDYAFRFALSGKCSSLTKEIYKSDLESFIKKHKYTIDLKSKKCIRLEYYDTLNITKKDIDELIKILSNHLQISFKVQKKWNEGFVIEAI